MRSPFLLIPLVLLTLAVPSSAQISLIPSPDPQVGIGGKLFVHNNELFTIGYKAFGQQLAKFDGSNLLLIPNPDSGYGVDDNFTSYNGKLYFRYERPETLLHLGMYDGSTVSSVPNLIDRVEYMRPEFKVFGENLYFIQDMANWRSTLVKYDGTSLSYIPNPNGGQPVGADMTVYKNGLYFSYSNPATYYTAPWGQQARFNGASITLIPNPVNGEIVSSEIVFQDKLYGYYFLHGSFFHLASFDGTNYTVYPNPTPDWGGQYNSFVEHAGNLYFKYADKNGVAESKYRLARFNGNTVSVIANPDSGKGVDTDFFSFRGNLYFGYMNAEGKRVLAKYNGSTLTLLPNPDDGEGVADDTHFVVYNNNLFFTYVRADGIYCLCKYDGNALTVYDIAEEGYGVGGSLTVYKSKLYMTFVDSTLMYHLACYSEQKKSTWIGAVSAAWENPANWSSGIVPDETTDVIIKSGTPNQPAVNVSTKVKSLTIEAAGLLTIKTGVKLEVKAQ